MKRASVLLIIMAVLPLGCAAERMSAVGDMTTKSALEIKAARDKFKAAYDAGDPVGLEQSLSADAAFAGGVQNQWTYGAKRIIDERWMPTAAIKMAGAYTITFVPDSHSPQLIPGSTAEVAEPPAMVDFGTFEMTPPRDGSRPRVAGRYSMVWVRESARGWVIKNMLMSPRPQP